MTAELERLEKGRRSLYNALYQVQHQNSHKLSEQDRNSHLLDLLLRSVEDGKLDSFIARDLADANFEQVTADSTLASTSFESIAPAPSASAATPQELAALKAEHNNLSHRFNALLSNFRNARDALSKANHHRLGWRRYAAHLEDIIRDAEAKHGITILDQSPAAAIPVATGKDAASACSLGNDGDVQVAQREHVKQDVEQDQQERAEVMLGGPQEPPVPNLPSESTQGESDESPENRLPPLPSDRPTEITIKNEPSSDTPMFVSERAVRKRKRGDSNPQTLTPCPKAEPKEESSPVLSRIRCATNSQDNVDLGDIEQRMMTPRKQKETAQLYRTNPISKPALTASLLTPTTSTHVPSPQQLASVKQPSTKPPSILTPLSVNVQKRAQETSKNAKAPVKRGLAFALSVLAEDGGAYGTSSPVAKKDKEAGATASTNGRLKSLLDFPAPDVNNPVISRPSKNPRGRASLSELYTPVPERRSLPFNKDTSTVEKVSHGRSNLTPRCESPLKRSAARHTSPQRKSKVNDLLRLRGKPPSELRLEDFKINPLANDGEDYAYSEVVRDKDERACLPGCTDMHCCGKQFRALALSQRPDPPLTPAQIMEEQKLLEEYLGDFAYKLATMSKEERADLWVEAKTQELANKYGKHRHRFSRMQSPPGFWNADFPDTQQLQQERHEAAKRERQSVNERYREAMRAGGRWLFRDE